MTKLNLASGQRPFPKPWVNVDIRDQGYPVDILADIRKLSMIEDNSVDAIVLSHAVEHIQLNDLLDAAKEWHRVLKVGGKMLVAVPNLKELAKAWIDGKIDNFIFLVNTYGAYQGYVEDMHKWGFNFNELRDRLSGWNGSSAELKWDSVTDVSAGVLGDSIFEGADVAKDWWILDALFTK